MPHNIMGIDPCDAQNNAIFNTMTDRRNNVQLRTGLFEACVALPTVIGNLGFGPKVDMSLFYTPVVNNIAGLADGWSFAFTTYDQISGRLTLHSGEVLDVDPTDGCESDTVDGTWDESGVTLKIKWTDGRIEILQRQGKSNIWTPERITEDGYRYVALAWDTVEHVVDGQIHCQIRLSGIRNDAVVSGYDSQHAPDIADAVKADAKRQLVALEYEPANAPTQVTVTFWPGTDESLQYRLAIKDAALQSVTPPEGPGWESVFQYEDHADCGWLLTSILTFDGLTETVKYVPEERTFPKDPKLQRLPCVSRHTVTPKGGGPDVVTRYTYSQNTNDEKAAYTTTLVEEAAAGGRTTVYVYDAGHAMVSETTTRGECETRRSFRAGGFTTGERGVGTFDELRARQHARLKIGELDSFPLDQYLALNIDVVDAYRIAETRFSRGSAYRSERSLSLFSHNKLAGVIAKKTGTRFLYQAPKDVKAFNYAYVTGESVCPGAYRCMAYTPSKDKDIRDQLGQIETTPVSGGSTKLRKVVNYLPSWSFSKGRTSSVVQHIKSEEGDVEASTSSYAYEPLGTLMTTITKEYGGQASGEPRATSQTVSILSGRTVRSIDSAGNRTEYAYDRNTGRLVSRTTCKGSSSFEEITTYGYPRVGRVEITEPDGRRRSAESDGRENVIREEVSDAAGSPWVVVFEAAYDELGRRVAVTRRDVAGKTTIEDVCTITYDDWGQPCREAYADGHVAFNYYDPVSLMREEWEGSATDKHRKRTWYDVDDSVCYMRWLDHDGKAIAGQWTRYANGRVSETVTCTERGGERVVIGYDDLGRTVRQQTFRGAATIPMMAMPRQAAVSGEIKISADDPDLVQIGGELYQVAEYGYGSRDVLGKEPATIHVTDTARVRTLVGARTFDGWGRVTSITRAGKTETMDYEGSTPVPNTVTMADGTSLNYEYFPELGHRPSKITGSGANVKTFTYMHGRDLTSSVQEGGTEVSFDHDRNERVCGSRAKVTGGTSRSIEQSWSEGGRLLGEKDVLGGATSYTYNVKGQRIRTARSADITTDHTYDALGKLLSEEVSHRNEKARVAYAYDAMHRETSRTFTLPDATVLTLSREYFADSRVKSVSLANGANILGSRAYTYDMHGRIANCATTGEWRPKNPKGKRIDSQTFTYDVLGNVTRCETRFGAEKCDSVYWYDESRCRLLTLEHTHSDYRPSATLTYDKNGRLTKDATGKTYAYDWLGRLVQAGSRYYTYDGMDRLATCGSATEKRHLVYDGMNLRGEYGSGDGGRYFYPGSAACSIQRVKLSKVDRTLFELCDMDGTLLLSYDITAKTSKHHAFTAYGEHTSDEPDSLLGFHGAYRDSDAATATEPASDRYPLGQGYRWYLPGQMQFQAPDSESPFGVGGWHAYGYCDGDPVNASDPSGHGFFSDLGSGFVTLAKTAFSPVSSLLSVLIPSASDMIGKIGDAIFWGAIGVLGAVFTGGASLVLVAFAATLAFASAVTDVVATAIEDSNPDAAATLKWVSFGLGLASGVAAAGAIRGISSLARQGGKWMQRALTQGAKSVGRGAAINTAKRAINGARNIVDDALGALPKPKQVKSMASQLYERAVKPHLGEAAGLAFQITTGVLGNAGVFEKESEGEAANESAERAKSAHGLMASTLPDAIRSRARNIKGGFRFRFR